MIVENQKHWVGNGYYLIKGISLEGGDIKSLLLFTVVSSKMQNVLRWLMLLEDTDIRKQRANGKKVG